jgi:hypothetical protein
MATDNPTTEPDRIPTMPPEMEPECVGAHSGLPTDRDGCEYWSGATRQTITRCGEQATHTVVMYDGELHERPMCDEHGEPDDVTTAKREWSASKNYDRVAEVTDR